MVSIKFNESEEIDENEEKKNKSPEKIDDLEDIAMKEIENIGDIGKDKNEYAIDSNNEIENTTTEDEEFKDIPIDDGIDEFDFSIETEQKEDKIPKSTNDCKLSALLDYLFFFYFMAMSLMYKELKNKGKFVKDFIEKNKEAINEIKLKIERFFANNMPSAYDKLIKFDDYAFLLGIMMLSINFHIEVQEAIKQQSVEGPISPPKEENTEITEQKENNPNKNKIGVNYDVW